MSSLLINGTAPTALQLAAIRADLGLGTGNPGTASGVALLDSNADLPFSQLPTSLSAPNDGVTSAQAQVANIISTPLKKVDLPAGDYLVTGLTNLYGAEFDGPGRLVKAVTGGTQQINSYADKHKYVVGREYLSCFHKKLIALTPANITFTGDSTTSGAGVSADYTMDKLILNMASIQGFPRVTTTNAGQSGQSTIQWLTTYLDADLLTAPALYVIRWGINDPYLPSFNLTVTQFLTNIRTGLAKIRSQFNVGAMSIILQMPNSTSDTPNNRDEKWYEAIKNGLLQAARDYQCCFVDTYAYLQDSRNATDYMDSPYTDLRHVHPANVMNLWITTLLGEVIFPSGLIKVATSRPVANVSGSWGAKINTDLPATYPSGVSMLRATNGFPNDGIVITFNHADDVQFQINCNYVGATSYSTRIGRANVWQAWTTAAQATFVADTVLTNVLPNTGAGFSQPGSDENMGTLKEAANLVVGRGFLVGPNTIVPSGTNVGTIGIVGHYPQKQLWWADLICWNGTLWEKVRCIITGTGVITTQQATTNPCSRIYLDKVWSV